MATKAQRRAGRRLSNWMKKCGRKWQKFKCSPVGKRSQKTWRGYMKKHC